MDFSNPNTEQIQRVEQLLTELPSVVPDIYHRAKDREGVINIETLPELLSELSIELNYDFDSALNGFRQV
jgi:hypothetical protein